MAVAEFVTNDDLWTPVHIATVAETAGLEAAKATESLRVIMNANSEFAADSEMVEAACYAAREAAKGFVSGSWFDLKLSEAFEEDEAATAKPLSPEVPSRPTTRSPKSRPGSVRSAHALVAWRGVSASPGLCHPARYFPGLGIPPKEEQAGVELRCLKKGLTGWVCLPRCVEADIQMVKVDSNRGRRPYTSPGVSRLDIPFAPI